MTYWNLKRIAPFAGIPVFCAILWVLQRNRQEAIVLLLWELLLLFGYLAAWRDIREQRIPNKLVIIMLGVWILVIVPQMFLRMEYTLYLVLSGVVGFLLAGTVFVIVYLVSRKGLGGGDVKLMAVSGLYLGTTNVLPAMLYGSVFAGVIGVILIISKKIGPRDTIPLVPFLYAGMVLAVFF